MSNDSHDDWTRPVPRPPRRDEGAPVHGAPEPGPDDTQLIPQGPRRPRDEPDQDEEPDQYDEQDQYEDITHEIPIGRRPTAADYGYAEGEFEPGGASYEEDSWEARPAAAAGPPRGRGPGGPGGPGGPPPRPPRTRRRRRPRFWLRRTMVLLFVLVLAYVGSMIWAVNSVWNSIERVPATPTHASRPADGAGTNFLLVGTDSREGLTREERNDMKTGHTEGARADTIMLLHLPSSGGPVLLSIPRDSYVDIPGRNANKINAAYSAGGPELLVDTVEQSTGLRIDGYLEIGFGGFVEVVNIVGSVEMCLEDPVTDDRTNLDLPAGCQELAGKEALNYVRMRYSDPRGDLGRVERQREFLGALNSRLATPSTVLVPWRLNDVGTATGAALTIGEDTSMWETGRMALAMRQVSSGEGESLTVPISDPNYNSPAGSAVLWDEAQAAELFAALNNGDPLSLDP